MNVQFVSRKLDRLFGAYVEQAVFRARPWLTNTYDGRRAMDRCFREVGPGITLCGFRSTPLGRENYYYDLARVELFQFRSSPVTVCFVSRSLDRVGVQFSVQTEEQLILNFDVFIRPYLNETAVARVRKLASALDALLENATRCRRG